MKLMDLHLPLAFRGALTKAAVLKANFAGDQAVFTCSLQCIHSHYERTSRYKLRRS